MSKPHKGLKTLPDHQREMLIRWLTEEHKTYAEAKELLLQDFNVRTSIGALSQFYAKSCFSLRYGEAKDIAATVSAEMKAGPNKFDEATIAIVTQKAFERAVARDGDLDELAILAKILHDSKKLELKQRDQQLTERRIDLMQFDAARAALEHAKELRGLASDSTLTDAQRLERARLRLFGNAPEGLRPLGETHGKAVA